MSLRRVLVLPAALGAAVLSQALLAPSAEAAGPAHGCPYGAVCVYPQNRGWNGDRPSLKYWSYGPHNLSHQYGTHQIFNNQYGGAKVEACFGYNGTGGGTLMLGAGAAWDFNLTPVNSLVLFPLNGTGCRR
jgi:hypothetical protein